MSTKLTMGVNYWSKADEAFDRGQQAYLDWCRELAVLYTNGTTTQEAIADRYDTDQARIAKIIAIGRDPRIFMFNKHEMPRSELTLYLLTTLPDDAFEELCKPTTTQAKILEYKRRLAPPKPQAVPEAEPRPPCPGVEGIGPGCWRWSYAYDEWVQEPIVDKAEMEARHAKELATPRPAAPLEPKYQEAINEAQKATDTLKEFLRQFASAPRLTCKGNEYVLAVLNAVAADLAVNEDARKVFGRAIASMYHPDSGKVRKDHDLMSSWNAFVTQMEVK